MFGSPKKEKTQPLIVNKYAAHDGDLNLAALLQYTPTIANPQLEKIMYEFSTKVFKPAYADYTTLVHTGNTDGSVDFIYIYIGVTNQQLIESR